VGERVVLRAPRLSDVTPWAALERANAEHTAATRPAPAPGVDRAAPPEVRATILRHRDDWVRDHVYTFFIAMRQRGEPLVGRVAFSAVVRGSFQNAYLGYWIDQDSQGRGLMTEALDLALGFAFGPLGLHRVQAAVMPSNEASQRVLEKCGFRREGLALRYLCLAGKWEDHAIFAITAGERAP
jgi:ribosomal-protein-alanine N-acetyltransferase